MSKLTGKQEAFANGIISGLSPLEAYRAAGYSQRISQNAQSVEAQRILNHPNISLMIETARAEAAEAAKWSLEKAIERLQSVNDCTYSQITKTAPQNGLQAPVYNAFLGSLDRLNKLTGVEAEAERNTEPPIDVPILYIGYAPEELLDPNDYTEEVRDEGSVKRYRYPQQ